MFTAGILTISDRVSQSLAADASGPALSALLNSSNPQRFSVMKTAVVSDEISEIQKVIMNWCDTIPPVDLLLTTGGTGFGVRDVTPEAVSPLFTKTSQGLVIAMLNNTLKITPLAALSRPVAGVRNKTVILTLPGSKKGSCENLSAILDVLEHAVELARGDRMAGEKLHKEISGSNGVYEVPAKSSEGQRGCGHHHHKKHGEGYEVPVVLRPRESTFPTIPISEAFSIIDTHAQQLPEVLVPVSDALIGHVLSKDVVAKENVPAFRASVVDGYAVIASDGTGTFPVISSSTAGQTLPSTLKPSTIARVTTGAPVPPGTTGVVMVEYTTIASLTADSKEEETITIHQKVNDGDNIREIGSDLKLGEMVVEKGTVVTEVGGEIGVLASVGVLEAACIRKPVLGVLSTGNEVVDFNTTAPLPIGKIRDTNKITISVIARQHHFECLDLGVAPDSATELESTLLKALEKIDVLVTTGGVSMGEMDLLKPVLEKGLGAQIHFGRVFLKPGKPTTFATLELNGVKKLIFALPGNPVSATVMFNVFVLPALRKMSGYTNYKNKQVRAKLTHGIKLDSRPEFYRANLTFASGSNNLVSEMYVTGTGKQQSSRMASLKGANCLLVLPPRSDQLSELKEGDVVDALILGGV
ncbi:hypothetical protein HK098_007981 [Nowakowskiella sp. JEL0407]|nr:hypothetical protein HK098_007981 [Nowakowskiella sp. JEL0407]